MTLLRWSCAILITAAGCATTQSIRWNREDIRPKGVEGDRQLERVKFWSGDSVCVWHSVVITRDSITGYPEQAPGSDRVDRRALPLAAVDSLKVSYRDDGSGPGAGSAFGQDLLLIGLILAGLFTP